MWSSLIMQCAAQSMAAMIFTSERMQNLFVLARARPANPTQDGRTEHVQCPDPGTCL